MSKYLSAEYLLISKNTGTPGKAVQNSDIWGVLIEQIIKLELRGLGFLVVYVLLQLVIFMTKQKCLGKIFEWIIISC